MTKVFQVLSIKLTTFLYMVLPQADYQHPVIFSVTVNMPLSLFIISLASQILLQQLTHSTNISKKFLMMQSSNGTQKCTTDEPTNVTWLPADSKGLVQCGLQCLFSYPRCLAFQYNMQPGKCDNFNVIPNNTFSNIVSSCVLYVPGMRNDRIYYGIPLNFPSELMGEQSPTTF